MELGPVARLEVDGQVCRVYAPPTGRPEDSGFCARCGMYDWRHTRPAPDGIAVWLLDRLARP